MSDDAIRGEDNRKAERREFLEKCGRFAAVTPPVITLMLAVSDKAKAQVVTSPGRLVTSAATTSTPTTTPTTTTNSVTSPSPVPSTPQGLLVPTDRTQDLAMIIEGMGALKVI